MNATMRCSNCGGLNPVTAEWCGQCMQRFVAPPPPPPPPPPPDDPTSSVPDEGPRGSIVAGLRHRAARPSGTVLEGHSRDNASPASEHGPFTALGDSVAWRCIQCGTSNPIDEVACSACGASFAATVADPAPVRASDPNTAALLSLLFPGIGHAYIGDWGAAIARAVLSLWVLSLTLVLFMERDIPGSAGLTIIFAFAAAGLWLVAAHDAHRSSSGLESLVILRGRRYLYVTIGLLGILFMGLVLATFASR